jgi:hypothetical protein
MRLFSKDNHRTRRVRAFIFLVCGAWLVAGCVIVAFKQQKAISIQATEVFGLNRTIVNYTASGFEPRYVRVPIGSSVVFTNTTTSTPLWVASDPYPDRTDYPELDAQHDSQTFVFRFTKTGTFSYHNQDVSVDHGIITVYDPEHPAPDIDKTLARQEAIRDKLLTLLVPGDPNSIFAVVDAIEKDAVLSLDCHEVAHDIGHKAYELYGFSGAMTYSNPERVNHASVMDICAGGYVHGILEEESLYDANFGEQPSALCAHVPASTRSSCYHGIGHALMFFYLRDIEKSLTGCRTMPTPSSRSRCFEGVWMEAFWGETEHAGAGSLGWDLDKPLQPCIDARVDAQPACFIYAPFGYLRTHSKDYSGAITLCSASGLTENQATFCLKGMGIILVSHFKASGLERTQPYAADLTYAEKYGFYEGVTGYGRLSGMSEDGLVSLCASLGADAAVCEQARIDSK